MIREYSPLDEHTLAEGQLFAPNVYSETWSHRSRLSIVDFIVLLATEGSRASTLDCTPSILRLALIASGNSALLGRDLLSLSCLYSHWPPLLVPFAQGPALKPPLNLAQQARLSSPREHNQMGMQPKPPDTQGESCQWKSDSCQNPSVLTYSDLERIANLYLLDEIGREEILCHGQKGGPLKESPS